MAISKGYSPTCSVVVCTRDRPKQLDECLGSLARLNYPDYDVAVVDNAPRDERSRNVALRWGVRYLTEPVQGVSRARNRGALACETEIVAYLDDDAVADPDWLKVLTREFADPRVAAVTGAILPINPTAQRNAAIGCGAERGRRRVVDRETPGWFEIANFGEMGDESNMAFRRSAFDVWPGFDERLGRGVLLDGGEGHDAFFTLIERGYRIVYNAEAVIRHPEPGTLQEQRSRHLRVMATTTAYVTYLAVEHPSCRRALASYLFDRLRGTARPWMNQPARTGARLAPRWLTLLTMSSGPWIYLHSRMAGRIQSEPEPMAAKNFETPPISSVALRDETCHLES